MCKSYLNKCPVTSFLTKQCPMKILVERLTETVIELIKPKLICLNVNILEIFVKAISLDWASVPLNDIQPVSGPEPSITNVYVNEEVENVFVKQSISTALRVNK